MKTLQLIRFAGLAVASVIAFGPITAFAHGKLEQATPASGSTVDVAPDTLQLAFNENLEPTFSSVKIEDATRTPVTKGKAKVEASNPRVMTLAVPKLTSGVYTVKWTVMTSDAHQTKGTYTFKVK